MGMCVCEQGCVCVRACVSVCVGECLMHTLLEGTRKSAFIKKGLVHVLDLLCGSATRTH